MIKKTFQLLLLLLPIGALLSQQTSEYITYKAQYPDEDKIHLISETEVEIKIVNGEIKILSKYNEEDLYLNNKASYYSEKSISYSTFFEISKIKASSFVVKKGKYKELKVKEFNRKDELSGSTFYDDNKLISFFYPKLQEGCKTRTKYIEKINVPYFLPSHYFQDFCPTIKSVYTITAHEDIKLVFKKFNIDSTNIIFTKQQKRGNIIYRWECNNVEKFKSESGSTNFRNEIAHMIPYIASYQYKNKTIDLLTGVEGLYSWYQSLVKDVNSKPSDTNLVNLVQSLIKDKKTELDKVKSIYYWAQKNIKYVALEYALGGFIPRNANDIFKKKYGDCKDNSSIMKEMLKIANIKSELTWIGTRSIPYSYSDVPTPSADNHMILSYSNNDTTYFLDATGRFHQFGLPTSFIQGKEALVAIDSNSFVVKQVPITPAKFNFLTDTTHLTIDNKNLKGSGEVIMNGYQKIAFYDILENKDTPDKIKEFYRKNFEKGNNKFLITQYKETNKYDYEKDFIIDYDFKINNYVSGNEDEKYVNLNLNKNVSYYKIKDDQNYDKEFKYKNYSLYVNELEIPKGYKVTYIPKNVSLENPKFNAHIKYTQVGNKIIYTYDITFNFIIINKNEHHNFNQFIEKLEKEFKESIVLSKEQ